MAANPHYVFDPAKLPRYRLSELDPLFHYHRPVALDFQHRLVRTEGGAELLDVSFASPVFGRATGWLVKPAATGRCPVVVYGHWGLGTATEFLPDALLYAKAGVVSLHIAAPWARPRPFYRAYKGYKDGEGDRNAVIQAVVDIRRGFDLLRRLPYVDADRIVYVGHSSGAQWGAILSAVDKRMKATVLIGGTPDQACIYLESGEPEFVALREREAVGEIVKYLEAVGQTDAIHFIGHAAPVPLLFQFARFERYFNEPAMQRYFNAASEPKDAVWYNTGHELNDPQVLIDRSEWLARTAGLPRLAPLLVRQLKRHCRLRAGGGAGAWPAAAARAAIRR